MWVNKTGSVRAKSGWNDRQRKFCTLDKWIIRDLRKSLAPKNHTWICCTGNFNTPIPFWCDCHHTMNVSHLIATVSEWFCWGFFPSCFLWLATCQFAWRNLQIKNKAKKKNCSKTSQTRFILRYAKSIWMKFGLNVVYGVSSLSSSFAIPFKSNFWFAF